MIYQIFDRNDPMADCLAKFVRKNPSCHFLQDPAWADVKAFWKWKGIAAMNEEGQLCGTLSVLLRLLPVGFHIAYAPRGPVCDRNDPEVMEALFTGLRELARQNRCLLTYLDPDEPENNEVFRGIMNHHGFLESHSDAFGGVQPQSVFRISLEGKDEETLLSSFAQKTRYNIRLAQRRGVTVEQYPGESRVPENVMEAFDQLMRTTGERDHFLVRSREYFETLLRSLGNDAVLNMAYLNGKPIAGSLAIFYGNKAWYLYGASANEHRGAMPNYLLQWTMLRDALQKGCILYDFRGVPGTGQPDDPLYGLYRFKKGFSGEHTRFTGLFLYYHRPLLGRLVHRAQAVFRKQRQKHHS